MEIEQDADVACKEDASESHVYKWLIFMVLICADIHFSEKWSQFKSEIKFKNRFHIKNNIIDECIHALRERPFYLPEASILYRAGKGRSHQLSDAIEKSWAKFCLTGTALTSESLSAFFTLKEGKNLRNTLRKCQKSKLWGYDKKDSGPPPMGKAVDFRANPVGISYLYTAESAETALAEIRPTISEEVSIAKFETREQLILANMVAEKGLSKYIGDHFSRVALGDASDYLPMQYLAESIKNDGFDGIRYSSSLREGGINVVIFNKNKCNILSSGLFRVDRVSYEFSKLFPLEGDSKAIVESISSGNYSSVVEYIEKYLKEIGSKIMSSF